MVGWRKVAHHVRRVGERMDGQTNLNTKNECWGRIRTAVIEGSDAEPRYGNNNCYQWRRRHQIAHVDILEGVGSGRWDASSTWRAAHDGK